MSLGRRAENGARGALESMGAIADSSSGMVEEIRDILRPHARLAVDVEALSPAADLFEAGMTSHSSVVVMLALEEHFDVHFPDEMLTREVFRSIDSIGRAITDLRGRAAV